MALLPGGACGFNTDGAHGRQGEGRGRGAALLGMARQRPEASAESIGGHLGSPRRSPAPDESRPKEAHARLNPSRAGAIGQSIGGLRSVSAGPAQELTLKQERKCANQEELDADTMTLVTE